MANKGADEIEEDLIKINNHKFLLDIKKKIKNRI